jgi:hypothetical protein
LVRVQSRLDIDYKDTVAQILCVLVGALGYVVDFTKAGCEVWLCEAMLSVAPETLDLGI